MEEVPPFSHEAQALQPGIYQHYKGNRYKAIGVARHSETLEELVVYQAMYGDESTWVRPLKMFLETVQTDAGPKPRFQMTTWQIWRTI